MLARKGGVAEAGEGADLLVAVCEGGGGGRAGEGFGGATGRMGKDTAVLAVAGRLTC